MRSSLANEVAVVVVLVGEVVAREELLGEVVDALLAEASCEGHLDKSVPLGVNLCEALVARIYISLVS